jgi:ligand-binding sensor domain-containing protein/signal transduction histidine kinase
MLAGASAAGAAEGYSVRSWRTHDGLPHSRVRVITQTADGYLWIGTSGGLARFDGVRFTVFDRSNTPAFRDDSILSLLAEKDGSLWIGTEGGGLLHYSGRSFRAYGPGEGLSNGFVRGLLRDREETLWIGTDRGLFRMRGQSINRLDGADPFPYLAVSRMHQDSAGRIWLGGSTPALFEAGKLRPFPTPSTDRPYAVQQLRGGALIGFSANGFASPGGGRLEDPRLTGVPRGQPVTALLEDRAGNLWIGASSDGLRRHAGVYRAHYRAPADLPDNTVLALFEDNQGSIWVGTQDGLARFSPKLVDTLTAADGLSDEDVTMIYQDRSGTLWLATGDGDLYRRSGARLSPFHFPASAGNPRVRTMFQDSRGVFWFGTLRQGVVRLEGSRATVYTTREGLRQDSIRAFYEDAEGHLWIGTGSGISKWDGSRFHNFYVQDGLAYGSIRAMAADASGNLWIGTDGGLSVMRGGKFVREPWMEKLGSERIWAVHCDRDGVLWLGTRGRGLFRVSGGSIANFTTREGLPTNSIHAIVEDALGNLWMSGPSGVFRAGRSELGAFVERRAGTFAVMHYSTADGLPSSQMSGGAQPSGWLTPEGEVWFPSVKGAVRIDPTRRRHTDPPPVLVEELVADGAGLGENGTLSIPAGTGKFEIHYTAVALLAPERISFKYKLEGFDDAWTTTTRRVAYYTGVPPGKYRFRVVAHDSAAPAQGGEASLAFERRPHLYQTGWFLAACAAAVPVCAGLAFLFYARQTKTRYALLLAERTRLAREMHDTVIQNCVGLSTLLEAAASTVNEADPATRGLLDRARAHVKLTLDEARQSVWDLRQASLGSGLVPSLSEYAAQLSREKNVAIQTEISGSPVALDEKTDRNLLLVAREAVRNAVTHADPKQVNVRLSFQPSGVKLEVTDDGCGFQPPRELAPETGCYGLVGMRERIEQLGGSFLLRSEPGRGVSIVADVPLSRGGRT